MQKVEGSSPFIRFTETPALAGVSSFWRGFRRSGRAVGVCDRLRRTNSADQIAPSLTRRLARAGWCDSLTRMQHRVGPDLGRRPCLLSGLGPDSA